MHSLKLLELADTDEIIPNCNIEVYMPTNISVHSADLPHPIQFNLFDNVQVALKLRKSHAHRHMVYMTLVDLDQVDIKTNGGKSKQPVRLTNTEMMHAIEAEEEASRPVDLNKKLSSRNKKKNQTSMYEILEKFRKMSVIESSTE
jgi:DIS3-like exonuclease 1